VSPCTSPLFSFETVQNNIRFTFKATAYAGDTGKMHSVCSTPELSERREIFAMGLKLSLHHY